MTPTARMASESTPSFTKLEGDVGVGLVLVQGDRLHTAVFIGVVDHVLEVCLGHVARDFISGPGCSNTIEGFNTAGD